MGQNFGSVEQQLGKLDEDIGSKNRAQTASIGVSAHPVQDRQPELKCAHIARENEPVTVRVQPETLEHHFGRGDENETN